MRDAADDVHGRLLGAGRMLFGDAFDVDGDWRAQLRATFRRRAMETHPDRAAALGRPAGELAREFQAVNDAYQLLASARPAAWRSAGERARAATRPQRADPCRPAPRPGAAARPLPDRPLRFAEYLFYTGRVPFEDVIEAVVWQRRQRPNLGDIAVASGYLTQEQVRAILARRCAEGRHELRFGEFAVYAGYLTPYQQLVIVGRQRLQQRPIGQFFVERGVIQEGEIAEITRCVFLHNARCRRARPRPAESRAA